MTKSRELPSLNAITENVSWQFCGVNPVCGGRESTVDWKGMQLNSVNRVFCCCLIKHAQIYHSDLCFPAPTTIFPVFLIFVGLKQLHKFPLTESVVRKSLWKKATARCSITNIDIQHQCIYHTVPCTVVLIFGQIAHDHHVF